ncbi:MAG: TlpA disulfide reductase family protein [Gemmatimonadaceae bacterium]
MIRGLVLVAATVAAGCRSGDGGSARVEVGRAAPAYSAVAMSGDSVSLDGLRGTVVLLNVWATWCHPCRDEIPELRDLHAKYNPRGFEVVGVSVDAGGAEDNVRAFMTEFAMNYPVWLDPDDRISTRYLLVGVPTTFLIDRDGVLLWRKTGPVKAGDTALTAAIERALGE